jgi:hypothetical protein
MPVVFYRAVSFEEAADWHATGVLRPGPGSCEGKHLATTEADARAWGVAFYGVGRFAVLRVTLDDAVAARLARWDKLDGIGPAAFATIEELSGAAVEEVSA